jgi:hypothetical protein
MRVKGSQAGLVLALEGNPTSKTGQGGRASLVSRTARYHLVHLTLFKMKTIYQDLSSVETES